MHFMTCVSAPATFLESHAMTHVPADVRVLCVQSKLSSSSFGRKLQLEAALHYL